MILIRFFFMFYECENYRKQILLPPIKIRKYFAISSSIDNFERKKGNTYTHSHTNTLFTILAKKKQNGFTCVYMKRNG